MKKQFPWSTLIIWVAAFIVAWFYNFQPDYEYSWYWMFFHGGLIVPNWIYSCFTDSKMCKPELYTTGYNVLWWLGVITMAFNFGYNLFLMIYSFIVTLREAKNKDN